MDEKPSRPAGEGYSRPRGPEGSRAGRPQRTSQSASRSRTRRRRNSGGRRAAKAALYVVAVIGISVLLAALAWMFAGDVLALNKPEHSATITLPESMFNVETRTDEEGEEITVYTAHMGEVADLLKENELIEYKGVFKLFASLTKSKTKLRPGSYNLNTDMDYRSLISNMSASSGSRLEITVTIPEGYTVAQIFQLLEEKGVASVAELNDMAANHDYKFDFLEGIPLGSANRLEGYLFPDTYRFYTNEEPLYAINKMLVNFDKMVTEKMRQEVAESGMSLQDVITIASLIEKETDGTDRALISSVIYNRLNHPEAATNGYLQIDAAIYYVTGRQVTQADYETVDSPYNTYLHQGLPPTAIANPGSEAIWAAIHPKETNYYYYALGTDKLHHFSRSYSEHQAFLASLPKDGD